MLMYPLLLLLAILVPALWMTARITVCWHRYKPPIPIRIWFLEYVSRSHFLLSYKSMIYKIEKTNKQK